MKSVKIHDSGKDSDRLQVTSYGNGLAYNVEFGEAGSPMRNIYLQGDNATQLRDEFDAFEELNPERDTRDVWFMVLDSYL